MEKRKIIFGTYDTSTDGWTLAEWTLSPPEQKTNFVDKPGGHGSWDLSTVLTDGIPVYRDRTLTARLELSAGDRAARETIIRAMVNTLDGMNMNITLPDDDAHYITGRVHVAREYNNMAHAAVTVTATCNPWKYAATEKKHSAGFDSPNSYVSRTYTNTGRLPVVPNIKLSDRNGVAAYANIAFGDIVYNITSGTYIFPDIVFMPGDNVLKYKGVGTLLLTYREAVLE